MDIKITVGKLSIRGKEGAKLHGDLHDFSLECKVTEMSEIIGVGTAMVNHVGSALNNEEIAKAWAQGITAIKDAVEAPGHTTLNVNVPPKTAT